MVVNAGVELYGLLRPLIMDEVAGIAALDTAIAAENRPDYIAMFQDTKTAKQANVEQMATVIRVLGRTPPEEPGFTGLILKAEVAVTERVGGTAATLRALLAAERRVRDAYSTALDSAVGITKAALIKARGRAIEHCHVLAAHIAKHAGDRDPETDPALPYPLGEYFAGAEAKACMRCHLDRPGDERALERGHPHPYTYICAGCHEDALGELPPDFSVQMNTWPEDVREARAIHQALGRASKLNAVHTVLRRLSGQPEDPPVAGREKALSAPDAPPSPDPSEPAVILSADCGGSPDADYVAALFDYRSVRSSW
jgi:hypothetical protein